MGHDWGDRAYSALIGGLVVGLLGLCPGVVVAAIVSETAGSASWWYIGAVFAFPTAGLVIGFVAPGWVDRIMSEAPSAGGRSARNRAEPADPGTASPSEGDSGTGD